MIYMQIHKFDHVRYTQILNCIIMMLMREYEFDHVKYTQILNSI